MGTSLAMFDPRRGRAILKFRNAEDHCLLLFQYLLFYLYYLFFSIRCKIKGLNFSV